MSPPSRPPRPARPSGLYKKEDVSFQTAEDVSPVASALSARPLSKLHLMGAPVDYEETPTVSDAAAAALGDALAAHGGSLKVLRLVGHRFESPDAIEAVLGGIGKGCKGLEELDLTNSTLGADGGASLKALLASDACKGVHTIRLEDCSLEEEGCLPVCEAVGGLASLRYLDLRFNEMEADSAAVLATGLAGKAALEKILLDEELEEGADPVIEALKALGKEDALVLGDESEIETDEEEEEEEEGEEEEGGEAEAEGAGGGGADAAPASPVKPAAAPSSGGFSFVDRRPRRRPPRPPSRLAAPAKPAASPSARPPLLRRRPPFVWAARRRSVLPRSPPRRLLPRPRPRLPAPAPAPAPSPRPRPRPRPRPPPRPRRRRGRGRRIQRRARTCRTRPRWATTRHCSRRSPRTRTSTRPTRASSRRSTGRPSAAAPTTSQRCWRRARRWI